jgi:2,4-dienoyl-CoA reductase-like NADH-dependent reductase (Old Yellow Enzyme family)
MDLFSPLALGDLVLPNRIVMAPLTRSRATPDRVPTPMMTEHYVQRVSAGLIIAEATNVVAQSNAWECAPGIFTAAQVEAWARLVEAVHRAGGRIALQLWHGGRVAADRSPQPVAPLSPSGVNDNLDAVTVWGRNDAGVFIKLQATPSRAMTLAEIRETVGAFGEAARVARAIGFDAVQLHAANGYLPHQFLSPHLNRRTDEYGGTPEARARFVLEVVEAMLRHFPTGRVGMRISPFTDFNGALDPDPTPAYRYLVQALDARGLGWLELADTNFWWGRFDRARMLELVRPIFGGPIIANGGIDPPTANELIRTGAVDAVSFGRLWIANPDLPVRIRAGGPYTKAITKRFYGGGPDGYNDYPTLAEQPTAARPPA